MADEDKDDKTEAPTGRRIQQAREDGQVPRSRELATFAVTMAGVALLLIIGDRIFRTLSKIIENAFRFDGKTLSDPEHMLRLVKESLFDALIVMLPFIGALFVVAAVVPLMVGGWNFSSKALEPKFSKLNPITGFKRLFAVHSLMEGAKAILKSTLIGGVASWVIWNKRDQILDLIHLPVDKTIAVMLDIVGYTILIVVAAMIILVLFDIPFQIWQYYKNLRMTKQEIKQEYKQTEGSPEIKGRIRQLQREAARRRMMQEIPNASVVVTNPTHYAVALRYEEGMKAPIVTAKGSLKLAQKIIDSAKEHKITLLRAPPFARALYHHTDLGQEIPQPLYTAAAQVLAYVFQLNHYRQHGGLEPIYPDNLPVPPEMDPANPAATKKTTK